MTPLDIIQWVHSKLSKGIRVALITVIDKEGSGPRDIGAFMAVSQDGEKAGTIGGGEVEELLIREALKSIEENTPRRLKIALRRDNVPSDALKTNMLCGGVIEVFVNVLNPKTKVVIFGGGHVGKPLGDIAHIMGYDVIVVDKNPSLANNERFPYAENIISDDLPGEVDKLTLSNTDVVVIAFGEPDTDYRVLRELIAKGFKGHIWVLCSKKRASLMISRLKDEGFDLSVHKDRLHMPAGLDIGSDTPQEIAVSIWAEIVCELKRCSKPVRSLGLEL